MTDTPRRGRKPGSDKLTDATRSNLIDRLRADTGPVNLKATAKEAGVSRPTLMRYIAAEPGLQEALDRRREACGRGYVKVTRPTKVESKPPAVVAKARDALPSGSQAALFSKLWKGLAEDTGRELERLELASRPDDLSEDGAVALSEHRSYALAHADAFRSLAAGGVDPHAVQTLLDQLPRPAPLHVPDLVFEAAERDADELEAQAFKAIHGYRPSARQLARLRGKPGRSFAPGEWDEHAWFRDLRAALKKAAEQSKPRKSYPRRPKDGRGRPLVPRGHMAKLLREQEAKGLTGRAAIDAAETAATAEIGAALSTRATSTDGKEG